MRFLRLTDDLYVAADHVTSVKSSSGCVVIQTTGGDHSIQEEDDTPAAHEMALTIVKVLSKIDRHADPVIDLRRDLSKEI